MDLPGYFPIPESKEKEKTLPKTEKEIISYLILHLKESTLLNKEEINYLSPFFSSYLITYFCKTLAKKAINNYTITITFHTQNKNLISLLLPALQDSELQKIFYIKTDYYLTPEKQDLFIQLKIKNPYLFKTRIGVPTREILGFVNLLNELFEHKYKDIQNSYEEELINTLQKTITKEDLLYIIYKNLTSPFLSRYFLFLSDRVKQDSQLDTKI
jgi:GH15 family glucan-1,4-alpha-glucosidase